MAPSSEDEALLPLYLLKLFKAVLVLLESIYSYFFVADVAALLARLFFVLAEEVVPLNWRMSALAWALFAGSTPLRSCLCLAFSLSLFL